MKYRIINGDSIPGIPWEDKPADCQDVVWRYSGNPVIPRDLIPSSNSIFNSAVVPFNGKFAGVFRCDDRWRRMVLHRGFSDDAISWQIDHQQLEFACDDPEIGVFDEGYDPRVCWIEDRYYVTWCNVYHGPTVGIAWTKDFETFHQLENAFLPYNRNGVMFPRRINGKYAMMSRPLDTGHTAFGDMFYSESPDLRYWGNHRFMMSPTAGWQSKKIGAGPIPIETSAGWLIIYHGVLNSCNGFVYSAGVGLLDLEQPWKVIARSGPYIISPQTPYECMGDVPNVVFPCAALCDAASGRLALYYGAADTTTAIAFGYVDELIDFALDNNCL